MHSPSAGYEAWEENTVKIEDKEDQRNKEGFYKS